MCITLPHTTYYMEYIVSVHTCIYACMYVCMLDNIRNMFGEKVCCSYKIGKRIRGKKIILWNIKSNFYYFHKWQSNRVIFTRLTFLGNCGLEKRFIKIFTDTLEHTGSEMGGNEAKKISLVTVLRQLGVDFPKNSYTRVGNKVAYTERNFFY